MFCFKSFFKSQISAHWAVIHWCHPHKLKHFNFEQSLAILTTLKKCVLFLPRASVRELLTNCMIDNKGINISSRLSRL